MKGNKGYSFLGVLLSFMAVAVLLVVLPGLRGPAATRRLMIVARDMAFVMPEADPDHRNPTLGLTAGERVTIIFRNDNPGMRHDLVLDGLGVRTRVLTYGQSQSLTFTVPPTTGGQTYLCSRHPRFMRGRWVID